MVEQPLLQGGIISKPLEMVQGRVKQHIPSLEFKVKIPLASNSLNDLGQITPGFGLNFLIFKVQPTIYTLAGREKPLYEVRG